MKSKIIKIIIGLFSTIILYGLFTIYFEYKLDYINILVSKQEIYPKTKLSEDMFYTVKLPNHEIYNNYINDYNQISSKYSSLDQIIKKDELISHNYIDNNNVLNKDSFLTLNKGQTLYSLPIDVLESFGNKINLYQNIDIYGELELDNGNIIIDLLISNIRVLDIKDHSGLDVNDIESTNVPYLINIGINNEYVPILMNLEKIGKVKIFINDTTYDIKNESLLNKDSLILNYLDVNKDLLKPSVYTK